MRAAYEDILSRLGKPLWYDEAGVPRYMPFHPDLCNDPYAIEAGLFLIACQQCGMQFLVADTTHRFSVYKDRLSTLVAERTWHMGDPPRHGAFLNIAQDWNNDCSAGATMNCEDLSVVQFWIYNDDRHFKWKRVSRLEGRRGLFINTGSAEE